MSNLSYYVYKLKNMPKKKALKLIKRKVTKFSFERILYIHDKLGDTRKKFAESSIGLSSLFLNSDFNLDLSKIDKDKAVELWRMYKAHRFDLLGSGWVKVGFINNAPGIEGYRYDALELIADLDGRFLHTVMAKPNVRAARKIWKLIEGDYEAIDWQKDFKSGYRWGTFQWYRPQGNAKKLGGDIKIPWELSRLQHLPRLAMLMMVLKEKQSDIVREYQNQLLDFIAQNPVRMGVNYMCTMDVGIRAANIALSYSLMKSSGVNFLKDFEQILCEFMFQQCDFIRSNLEWSESLTSNHYFADIAGLLFGSAVLPECLRKTEWFKFAASEIQNEIVKQFNEEGTNKEGSTAYHRLTGEMAVYSIALIEAQGSKYYDGKIDSTIYDRLYRAGMFIKDLTRPDGKFSQLGDNDSGVFFKMSITGELLDVQTAVKKYSNLQNYLPNPEDKMYLDENLNDGYTFISAVEGMLQEDGKKCDEKKYPLEHSLIKWLRNNSTPKMLYVEYENPFKKATGTNFELPYQEQHIIKNVNISQINNISVKAYPQFGVYIYRNEDIYLCINLTKNGQKGNGGHAHNDKLSFELFIKDQCIFEDCGTYVYTAMPEKRNLFRSVAAHNTINVGYEQNDFINLFSMKNNTSCDVILLDRNRFIGRVKYKGCIHIREFMINSKEIKISDYCNKPFNTNFVQKFVTVGYGKLKI